MARPDIDEQIKCLDREIKLRKRVYPRLIIGERMTQEKADREIETMQAAAESLFRLRGLG